MTMRTSDLRKPIPLWVKVEACLLALGFTYEQIKTPKAIHWDHTPPLGLRERRGRKFIPDQHDPRHIVPRLAAGENGHLAKTNGGKAHCADGDLHKIAKAKRLSAEQEAFRARVLKGTPGKRQAAKKRAKSNWPQGRKIRSKSSWS